MARTAAAEQAVQLLVDPQVRAESKKGFEFGLPRSWLLRETAAPRSRTRVGSRNRSIVSKKLPPPSKKAMVRTSIDWRGGEASVVLVVEGRVEREARRVLPFIKA